MTFCSSPDAPEQLKYKYAVVQLFSLDLMFVLMDILRAVGQERISAWQQSMTLVSGQMLVSIVTPVLAIVKFMLSYLIKSRGVEFHDLSALSVLFSVHMVMCSGPLPGITAEDAQHIQTDIVEILLAYTQPSLQGTESQGALSLSLWTLMVKELLNFILQAPRNFFSGLTLLSELLPLPLPIQTKDPLTEDEVLVAVNSRKLWGAHLHSLTSLIQQMVKTLASSTCQPLHHSLRRVCVQLADLAAPTALVVVRAVLDALLSSLKVSKYDHCCSL